VDAGSRFLYPYRYSVHRLKRRRHRRNRADQTFQCDQSEWINANTDTYSDGQRERYRNPNRISHTNDYANGHAITSRASVD
jgi:hypothetical protein